LVFGEEVFHNWVEKPKDRGQSRVAFLEWAYQYRSSGHTRSCGSRASGVYILAADLFVSGNNYRADSLRRFDDVTRIDSTGSSGGEFDRCGTFASNSLFENRQLVKNLVNANKVTGDENFLDAIDMSEAEYATRLDSLYGSTRL
jgi:hypothetical protein